MARVATIVLATSMVGSLALTSIGFQSKLGRNTTLSMSLCGPAAHLTTSEKTSAYYWSNKNRDATCTGAAPYTAPSDLSAGPSWSWKDATASIVSVHPCIDSQKSIYLSHRNGVVRKFRRDGVLLWENSEAFKGEGAQFLTGGGVISNGSLFVGAKDGTVSSIDMQSGRTNWNVSAAASAGQDSWSLLAHNGLIITAGRRAGFKVDPDYGGNEVVVALDARNGRTLWTFKPEAPIYNLIGSFVDGPPSLIFSDCAGVPYRISLCDGSLLWRNQVGRENAGFTTGGAIVEPSSGRVFVTGNVRANGMSRGSITAYDALSGARLWEHLTLMEANNGPAVGRLQPGSERLSVVVAVGENPSFPDPVAELLGHYQDGRPVVWYSKILALDPATGAPTGWEYTPEPYRKPQAYGDKFPNHICLPDSWSNAAIGGDGSVYVGHMSGRVFALRDADGDGILSPDRGEVSSYFGERCYQGSPGLAPGMLVATPCDGIHVFEV